MEGALIRDQMFKLGMTDVVTMGNTGIQSETFNKVAGAAAEGALCTGFSNPHDSEKGRKFVEEYKKAGYRESFNELSGPLAYDATNIILEALKKVGPDDKIVLAKEIRAVRYDGVLGETIFDEFGQTKYGGIKIYVSQDGAWKLWESSEYATGKRKLPKK